MRLRRDPVGTGTRGGRDSHDDDIVELTRVPLVAEAVAIKQDLERVGVFASVFESDAGGWAPHCGIGQGNRVMVRARDLAEAQQLLSHDGGQVAVEILPESPPFKKYLRRHGESPATKG
jgi:hypothetical protein